MAAKHAYRVSRRTVTPEPLLNHAAYDYADSFEVRLDQPDSHPAEVWARTALEESPRAVRWLILFVHARVVRFQLGPRPDVDHILGWRILASEPAALQIEARGPLLRAVIVARRTSATTAVATTFLFYERPLTRLLWRVVGPLHRRISPYLLGRAAASLATEGAPSRDTPKEYDALVT